MFVWTARGIDIVDDGGEVVVFTVLSLNLSASKEGVKNLLP